MVIPFLRCSNSICWRNSDEIPVKWKLTHISSGNPHIRESRILAPVRPRMQAILPTFSHQGSLWGIAAPLRRPRLSRPHPEALDLRGIIFKLLHYIYIYIYIHIHIHNKLIDYFVFYYFILFVLHIFLRLTF